MEYETLHEVTEVFFHEFQKKYHKLQLTKHELLAPGYSIRCGIPGAEFYLFMLKFTSGGILFDVRNSPEIPGYNDRVELGMLRRLLAVEYENPRMVETVLDFADKFLRDAGVL